VYSFSSPSLDFGQKIAVSVNNTLNISPSLKTGI
jgi:hypothetical protein